MHIFVVFHALTFGQGFFITLFTSYKYMYHMKIPNYILGGTYEYIRNNQFNATG